MDNIFAEFISTYGTTILYTIITAVIGYIGITIKKLFAKVANDRIKKSVAETCVKAVEQLYKDLHGEEKLEMCVQNMTAMLAEKGITITDIEIRMLIEAAVNELNKVKNDIITTEEAFEPGLDPNEPTE